jgi:predicted ArsR family transcriptional regulator
MKYTSKHLDNQSTLQTQQVPSATTERMLMRLKTQGPASTATLAQELDITAEAARLQVQKLLAEGLIMGSAQAASGAGRPRQHWELSEAGYARFPDAHKELTVQLIGSIRTLFGEQGMDKLIAQRENEMRGHYLQACAGLSSLKSRVERLAGLRNAEGYMARVEKQGKDWLLIEDHCPICAAARSCQGFCRSELDLFREVLGSEARVEREDHLLSGARRCVYRVSKSA